MRIQRLALGLLAAILLTAAAGEGVQHMAPQPEVACATTPGSGEPYRVLMVGESWAAGARLFPELPLALAQRLNGRPVSVCSMGFSGKNTGKIYRGVERALKQHQMVRLLGAKSPDNVVILTGINDQIQHVGAAQYAGNTAKIAHLFGSVVQVVTVPRIRLAAGEQLSLPLRLKNHLYRAWYDHGNDDPLLSYRAELQQRHPEILAIEYDAFLPEFVPEQFEPDGVHLTAEAFRRYGGFLGSHVALTSGVASVQAGADWID